jgi:ATP phosphoribosyltransferase regulatory subunit
MMHHGHHRALSLPTGTETFELRKSARNRRVTRMLEDHFYLWGYDPAETALVDYYEVYQRLLPEANIRQTYRAIDRAGDILAVRADSTLFLAKQLGVHLTHDDLPVRVYYNDQILRAEDEHDIASNEYQQAGIELVGVPGVEGDVEVLILALEALTLLGLGDAATHIGSHALVRTIAELVLFDPIELADRARRREIPADLFDDTPVPRATRERLRDLLLFVGPPDRFEEVSDRVAGDLQNVHDEARALLGLVRATREAAPAGTEELIRVDVSELGAYGYYTGMAFSMYHPDAQAAIVRGGRYDRLLQAFGFDAPSVGFSMYPRKLPADVHADDAGAPASASGSTMTERAADARARHAAGERVRL